MKRIFKVLFFLLLTFNLASVFAGTIDHFQVEFSKPSAMQFEGLDITIKAVDKNNEIVKDYVWTVLAISETDDSIQLPEDLASDNWYTFKLSDQWVKKFENWVKFSSIWEQSVSVYDADDYQNLIWKWEITIIQANTDTKKIEIEILTPETNTTITKNSVKLSGATKKNHQIKIEVNNKDNITTTSNSDWIFEKEIENLNTWDNTFKAYVLDADENIIWESSIVTIKVDNNKPSFKKIILSPLSASWTVEELTDIDVKVFANKWLKTVKLLFNDWVISLSETEDWVYTWSFKAPEWNNTYNLDVVLADNLGHIVTEKNTATLQTLAVEKNSAKPEEKPKPKTCNLPNIKESDLKITWLKLVTLKNKSILTWNKLEKAESYDIFKKNSEWKFELLKNVKIPKFEIEITWDKIKYNMFAVSAKAKWCIEDKETVITWDLSDATKIKTWPAETILMLILALILWFGFMFIKRRKA